jgi:hypothetical protein
MANASVTNLADVLVFALDAVAVAKVPELADLAKSLIKNLVDQLEANIDTLGTDAVLENMTVARKVQNTSEMDKLNIQWEIQNSVRNRQDWCYAD